jgi:Tfp pilus assembly protein PilO
MKPSERRLILILVVVGLVAGGAILSQILLRKQRLIDRREQSLALQQTEAEAVLTDAELWHARLDWLRSSQPAMSSENQASEELLETLLSAAAKNGLVVQKKQLHETVTKPFYREVGVTLTVKGQLPSVFRWMHGMLKPEVFLAVPEMKIIADDTDKSAVTAMVHFSRLYTPATAGGEAKGGPQL